MKKIFDAAFYELFEEEEKELLKILPPNKKFFYTWKTIQEQVEPEPHSKIISIRTQSKIPIEWANKIDAIITRSSGYDHVTEYLKKTKAKIKAAYLPEYAARAVAEHALMLWTCLLRKLNQQKANICEFRRDGLTGREIRNRSITVIGVGKIGSEIVDIAHGLKMKIFGVDIVPREEISKKYDLEYLPLDTALSRTEIAVCALPLTDITKGLLNYGKLQKMPKNSIFINIARGEISPSQDLLRLLDEKHLAGVGLDVYDCEKELAEVLRDGKILNDLPQNTADSINATIKLMKHENAILTPHNAFNTLESVQRKCTKTCENLNYYFKTEQFISKIC